MIVGETAERAFPVVVADDPAGDEHRRRGRNEHMLTRLIDLECSG
jgi:hypothetical protein